MIFVHLRLLLLLLSRILMMFLLSSAHVFRRHARYDLPISAE